MSEATAATANEESPQEAQAPLVHPWTQLPYEHSSLLRLAPLPADRSTGLRPLLFAQFSSVERHSEALSYLRLSVRLPEYADSRSVNTLELWADHEACEVRVGPDELLHAEPANRGIGRFLMAQAIAWAQKHASKYSLQSVALSARDALTDDSRERRDQALQAQGLVVDYPDESHLKARCSAKSVATLHTDWHFEKVQQLSLIDTATMLKRADSNLREQEVKLRERDEKIALLKREDGTLRFSIACLVAFCAFQAGLLIWIAAR